ncbi:MAG: VOC family protein [Ginsengibacter sp.]
MQPALPFKINHLQHVGIPGRDIITSKSFYERLGFVNIMQAVFTINEEGGTCIMMQNNAIIIELYQLPASHLDEIKQRPNGHIDHIAFEVDDIDGW